MYWSHCQPHILRSTKWQPRTGCHVEGHFGWLQRIPHDFPMISPTKPFIQESLKSLRPAPEKTPCKVPRTICFSDASGAGATASGAATTASGAGAGTPQRMKTWTCWYFFEGKLQFGNAWMNEATVLHFASVWDDSQFLSSWIHTLNIDFRMERRVRFFQTLWRHCKVAIPHKHEN